ncbi:MAG TPA: glycosyltransferase family 4 protein [Pyrinomonadaceae bacterium]|jgi:glycosyltransferase involved in cell wall biosynthesis
MLELSHQALYAAFDRFPTRKGAAVHIDRFARALFTEAGGGLLYVLGDDELPAYQREGAVEIVRFCQPVANLLERAVAYGRRLSALVEAHGAALRLCHFRDPWSGWPLLARPHDYVTVYEVNGLPSVELPHTYKGLAPSTLAKLAAREQLCLRAADHVITPSHTIRARVLAAGVPAAKVTVIPNGAEVRPVPPRPADAPARYLLYFGALQPWQGVDTLLRAFARLADFTDLRLVICAAHHSHRARVLMKLAARLEIGERVVWHFALSEEALAPWRAHALVSVAPLVECARNVEQGCAPLKILESLAAGVPVVASDLPAVRELMTDGEHGRLVHPDRPGELARTLRVLLQHPDRLREMGARARAHVARHFTWARSTAQLVELYRALGNNERRARAREDRMGSTPP